MAVKASKGGPVSRIDHCVDVHLQSIGDTRGSLIVANQGKEIPFNFRRVYFLHQVPPGESRGHHAHRRLEQVLVCVAGAVEVTVDDGTQSRMVPLVEPSTGLYIPPMIWRGLSRFSESAVVLSIVSEKYDEADYIRDYRDFQAEVRR